jgi:protease-4
MNRRSLVILLSVSWVVLIILFLALMSVYKATDFKKGMSSRKTAIFGGGEVGVLEVKGVIMDSDDILDQIRELKERDRVKAVIVRIDSPGGGVAASQEIYEELKKLDKIKPVVASLSSVAASGGYYVALGARSIVANLGTITGSIGVIMQLAYLEKLYQFIKVTPITIKSGKFKDIGNTTRKMTAEERELLQKLSDNMHEQFKKAVADGRKMPMSVINEISDGRIFSGQQAFELGLVDHIGTFEDAIRYASKIAKLSEEPELYYPKDKRGTLQDFFSGASTFINKTFIEANQNIPVAM